MSIDRQPADSIAYFESANQVAQEEDRVEVDIKVTGWEKKMRIRALSFAQMEKINKMATVQETDKETRKVAGELDKAEWTYWTIKEGVVRPYFTIVQARELADNNGAFVRELADEIWNLGRISKRMWDAFILEQQKAAALEESDNPNADDGVS